MGGLLIEADGHAGQLKVLKGLSSANNKNIFGNEMEDFRFEIGRGTKWELKFQKCWTKKSL